MFRRSVDGQLWSPAQDEKMLADWIKSVKYFIMILHTPIHFIGEENSLNRVYKISVENSKSIGGQMAGFRLP